MSNIYNINIYTTQNFTTCFHMIFIIIVNYYSLMSYFPYVACVRSQDRILLFRPCFLSFLVHYYSAIPFHIGKGHWNVTCEYNFQKTKDSEKSLKKSIAVQVCTFKEFVEKRKLRYCITTIRDPLVWRRELNRGQ